MASDELIVKIGAETKSFTKELDKVKSQVKDLEKGLAKTAKISAAAFTGLAVAAGLAVKSFAKFEDGFSDVVTLLDKSSFKTKKFSKGIEDMKSGVLELGAATGESFDVLNKALFDTVSAGVEAGDSLDFLAAATDLAAAGATDTSIAVEGMTSAMNAFGLKASDATLIAQKFFVAQRGGKTTVAEMAQGFGKAGATAKAYGVSLDELLGAVSAVTLGGVRTSAAYTGFNAVLAGIGKPTADATKEAKRLGIEFSTTALRTQGLTGFLKTLSNANGFTQKSVEKLFGSVEAQKVAFALTGSQAKAYAKQIKDLGDKQKLAGDFAAALAVKNATTTKSINRLKKSAEAVAITIGEKLAPDINSLAESLTGLIKEFNDLDESQKDAIVTMGKAAALLTGFVTIATTALLALSKLRTAWKGVGIALSKIGPALGRIGVRIAGISVSFAELGAFAKTALTGVAGSIGSILGLLTLSGDTVKESFLGAGKTVEDMEKKILQLKDKLITKEDIGQDLPESFVKANDEITSLIDQYQGAIDKQNELNRASLASDFGTGELLIKPKVEETSGNVAQNIIDSILGGQDSLSIPLSIEGQKDGGVEEKAKSDAKKLSAIQKEENAKSIEEKAAYEARLLEIDSEASGNRTKAKIEENDRLKEINQAKHEELSQKEIEFIQSLQDLDEQAKQIKEIKNEEEKAAELENLAIKNEEILIALDEFNLKKQEQDAANNERKKALEQEIRDLDMAETAALNEQDLQITQNKINTQEEAERIAAQNKLQRQVQERNKFKQDEIKHGTEVAQLKKILASQEVSNFKNTAANLEQLTQSKNSKLKAIGKAAAHANAAIKTAEGAISAYTSLAGIPFVGPALGAAAAGALLAFGVEQQATIARMAQGGIVPNGQGGARDRIPALLQPGELVVPQGITSDFIQSVGRPDISAENGASNAQQIEIGFTDNAFEIIERKQNEDVALGIRES